VRRSVTLIEIIFSIVIIGIAMVAIPTILSQTMKSNEFSLDQEALLAGATKMGNILTYEWDENNTGPQELKYVLDVINGDNELNRYPNINSIHRVGHFIGQDRRRFDPSLNYASNTLGSEETQPDDIDDFNGKQSTLITNVQSDSDYVKEFTFTTKIIYVEDNASYLQNRIGYSFPITSHTGSTNIKMVEVKIVDKQNSEQIATLRSYATNIGSTKLLSRIFN